MSDDPFGSASDGNPAGGPDTSDIEDGMEATKQLNVEIPRPVYQKLKVHCARTGANMKDVVARLIEENLQS